MFFNLAHTANIMHLRIAQFKLEMHFQTHTNRTNTTAPCARSMEFTNVLSLSLLDKPTVCDIPVEPTKFLQLHYWNIGKNIFSVID